MYIIIDRMYIKWYSNGVLGEVNLWRLQELERTSTSSWMRRKSSELKEL